MYIVYTCKTELVIFWWIFKWYTQHGPNNLTDKRYMWHVHWKLKCLDQIGRDGGLYHSLREQNMYDRYIVLSAERLYAIDISDFLLERNYRRYHEREKTNSWWLVTGLEQTWEKRKSKCTEGKSAKKICLDKNKTRRECFCIPKSQRKIMINSQNEITYRGILLFSQKEEKLIENDKIGRWSSVELVLPEWKQVTQYRIISYVIKEEYKLEFEQKPPFLDSY